MNLDLNDEQTAALAALLRRTIDADRYPLSSRIRALQAILDRIEPPPVREPLPAPTVLAGVGGPLHSDERCHCGSGLEDARPRCSAMRR